MPLRAAPCGHSCSSQYSAVVSKEKDYGGLNRYRYFESGVPRPRLLEVYICIGPKHTGITYILLPLPGGAGANSTAQHSTQHEKLVCKLWRPHEAATDTVGFYPGSYNTKVQFLCGSCVQLVAQ
jgi:hypothetical protein